MSNFVKLTGVTGAYYGKEVFVNLDRVEFMVRSSGFSPGSEEVTRMYFHSKGDEYLSSYVDVEELPADICGGCTSRY